MEDVKWLQIYEDEDDASSWELCLLRGRWVEEGEEGNHLLHCQTSIVLLSKIKSQISPQGQIQHHVDVYVVLECVVHVADEVVFEFFEESELVKDFSHHPILQNGLLG